MTTWKLIINASLSVSSAEIDYSLMSSVSMSLLLILCALVSVSNMFTDESDEVQLIDEVKVKSAEIVCMHVSLCKVAVCNQLLPITGHG